MERVEKLNTALRVLLEHREKEGLQNDENMRATLDGLVIPYLEELEATRLDGAQRTLL